MTVNAFEPVPASLTAHFVDLGPGRRWCRFQVHGNGSCFYNSVAAALNYEGYTERPAREQAKIGKRLRIEFQRTITDENWSRFWRKRGLEHLAPTAGRARKEVADPAVWANLWTIYVFSCWIRTRIVFFDYKDGGRMYCGVTVEEDSSDRPPNTGLPDGCWNLIKIAWVDRCHFDPLCVVVEPEGRFPRNWSQFMRKREDGEGGNAHFRFSGVLAKRIMDTYGSEGACAGATLKDAVRGG